MVDIENKSPFDAEKMIPEEYRVDERARNVSESTETEFQNSSEAARFDSKYEREFETLSVLGRGGFGVVFEARNLNDQNVYAVKRIELPDDPDRQQKILRESKANTELSNKDVDMTHFIRYFQAWEERNVPTQWITNHDQDFEDDLDLGVTQSNFETGNSETTNGYDSNKPVIPVPSGNAEFTTEFGELEDIHWEGDSDGSWGESDTENSAKFSELSRNVSNFANSTPGKVQIHGARLRTAGKNNSMDLRRNYSVQSDGSGIEFVPSDDGPEMESDSDYSELSENGATPENSNRRRDSVRRDSDRSVRHFLYLHLQLCSRKTLKHVLRERAEIEPEKSLNIFYQICKGVKLLHEFHMIHRDLKPANILFSIERGIVKLGDLGLITMKDDTTESDTDIKKLRSGEVSVHTSGVGTRLYMAPEIRSGENYSYPVDIFALGIILLELFSQFGTESERVVTILKATQTNQTLPKLLLSNYTEIAKLIKTMLAFNPSTRPEIDFILDEINELLKAHQEESGSNIKNNKYI